MEHDKQIPIWFFIGAILAVYGALISGYGLVTWNNPPPPAMSEDIYQYHANVWWGALLFILGVFYVVRFRPSKDETLTGRKQ